MDTPPDLDGALIHSLTDGDSSCLLDLRDEVVLRDRTAQFDALTVDWADYPVVNNEPA
jgi:hypothetical protein